MTETNIKLIFLFGDWPPIKIPLKLRDGSDLDDYFLKLKLEDSHLINIIYFDENGGNFYLLFFIYIFFILKAKNTQSQFEKNMEIFDGMEIQIFLNDSSAYKEILKETNEKLNVIAEELKENQKKEMLFKFFVTNYNLF